MNTSELVDAIAENTGLTKKDTKASVDSLVAAIRDALKKGDDVRIAGLGTFVTKAQAARQGRNPQTGAPINIAASTQAKFRPAKELKESLNG